MTPASRVLASLQRRGYVLPEPYVPRSMYVPVRQVGALLFCAGVTSPTAGKVGRDLSVAEAARAAGECALLQLSALRKHIGALEKVECLVRLTGYVNAIDDFEDSPAVIDGASEVFLSAFGPSGEHVRSAIGVSGLPGGSSVELEVIVMLREVEPIEFT